MNVNVLHISLMNVKSSKIIHVGCFNLNADRTSKGNLGVSNCNGELRTRWSLYVFPFLLDIIWVMR